MTLNRLYIACLINLVYIFEVQIFFKNIIIEQWFEHLLFIKKKFGALIEKYNNNNMYIYNFKKVHSDVRQYQYIFYYI